MMWAEATAVYAGDSLVLLAIGGMCVAGWGCVALGWQHRPWRPGP